MTPATNPTKAVPLDVRNSLDNITARLTIGLDFFGLMKGNSTDFRVKTFPNVKSNQLKVYKKAYRICNEKWSPAIHTGDVILCQEAGWNGNGMYLVCCKGQMFFSALRVYNGEVYILQNGGLCFLDPSSITERVIRIYKKAAYCTGKLQSLFLATDYRTQPL